MQQLGLFRTRVTEAWAAEMRVHARSLRSIVTLSADGEETRGSE